MSRQLLQTEIKKIIKAYVQLSQSVQLIEWSDEDRKKINRLDASVEDAINMIETMYQLNLEVKDELSPM